MDSVVARWFGVFVFGLVSFLAGAELARREQGLRVDHARIACLMDRVEARRTPCANR